MDQQNVAQFLVSCLRTEGVKYVFGIPGEENIKFVRAVAASSDIRFILARHEQGASFMPPAGYRPRRFFQKVPGTVLDGIDGHAHIAVAGERARPGAVQRLEVLEGAQA